MAWGPADSPRVLAPPPLIYFAALGAALAVDRALGVPAMPIPKSRAVGLGACTRGLGGALALIATVAFKRAGTNVVPNRPATALVTTGVFSWSRNPGYIGQTLIYAGLGFGLRSVSAFIVLWPLLALIDRAVVAREERYLTTKFGWAFRAYAVRVPRWL